LEQNKYIKVLTKELEARRAELFNNLDLSLIPLDKLSTIEAFLSEYQTSEHKEKTTKQINLTNIVKYTLHTSIADIELSIRAVNCLRAANIETV
jgi:DNA-directed RNA polymerase alpha subunit